MRAALVTPRAAPVVALEEAKLFLRVDGAEEDELVGGLVEAATDHVEKETGRLFGRQTWRVEAASFAALVRLPVMPVIAVTEIEAVGPAAVAAVDPASWEVRHYAWGSAVIVAEGFTWPSLARTGDAVRVTVAAGHDPAPKAIETAIKLLAANWYRHRDAAVGPEAAQELPHGVRSILDRWRRFR